MDGSPLLIIADAAQGVQAQQLEPFAACGRPVVVAAVNDLSATSIDSCQTGTYSAIALQPHFRRSTDEVANAIDRLRQRSGRVSLLDSTDPTGLRWPAVVPLVDVYLKKQLMADINAYTRPSVTGYWFADYCAHERGWPMDDWRFSSTPVVADSIGKLTLGWNLGVAAVHQRLVRKCKWLEQLHLSRRWSKRPIDVHCIVQTLGPTDESFYSRHRREAAAAVAKLPASITRLLNVFGGGVPAPLTPAQYRRSLRRSKLCISPFGWGEVCHRDYEAVASGCLLFKPDMKLVRTAPDIFRPNETYIPFRWDCADLPDLCAHWLGRPREAEKIVRNAQAAYRQSLSERTADRRAIEVRAMMIGQR